MKESAMNCKFYGQSIEKQIPQKFENHGCIPEPSLWFVWESWLWIIETTLIASRGLFLILITTQHRFYLRDHANPTNCKMSCSIEDHLHQGTLRPLAMAQKMLQHNK
jgi:hypothetical protein